MGIKRIINYAVVPAAIGAVAGFVAQKMGYDISAVEGMKQAVMSALPGAVVYSSYCSKDEVDEAYDLFGKHPYSLPALMAGTTAGFYALSSMGMEWLSGSNISQGFVSVVGGLEGAVSGMWTSTIGKNRKA